MSDSTNLEENEQETRPSLTVLSPEEALEKINAGEPLENAQIEDLRLKGNFSVPIRMKNVRLIEPHFRGVTFQEDVVFEHCTLEKPRCGNTTTFAKNFDLRASTLRSAHFTRLEVGGTLNLENCIGRGKLQISRSTLGRIRLWGATLRGWFEIRQCDVKGEADFRSFHADEGVILNNCHFHGQARFRGAVICKKLDCNHSHFEDLLDLSKAKLHDFTYLEDIIQGENQTFSFSNVIGERILIRTDQIDGRLHSEQGSDYEAAMHEYAFLKRVFETMHQYDREDWAFYRFKVNQRRCGHRSWFKPWTIIAQFFDWLILDQGCGYCTRPFRAIRTAGILMVLFAIIYAVEIRSFHVDNNQVPFEGGVTTLANRVSIGLFQSVATFTSGLSSISDMAKGWINVCLMMESLLGTLVWGLFIVAFSRKVIR